MERGKGGLPFPLDHFFFCFLPVVAAAGAYILHIETVLDRFLVAREKKHSAKKAGKTDHDCWI